MQIKVTATNPKIEVLVKENLIEYFSYYPNLFHDQKLRSEIKTHLISSIESIEIEEGITQENEEVRKKHIENKRELKFYLSGNKDEDRLTVLKGLAPSLLTLKIDNGDSYNNCVATQGPTKLDLTTCETYGESLTNGFGIVLAKLAILKQQREEYLQKYFITGECNNTPSNDFSENIARLLILASTEIVNRTPEFQVAEEISNSGIEACNSSFLISNLTNTFAFEQDFDSYFSKGSFQEVAKKIDQIEDQKEANKTGDLEQIDFVLEKINQYYGKRLTDAQEKGQLDLRYQEIFEDLFRENTKNTRNVKIREQETRKNELETKVRS